MRTQPFEQSHPVFQPHPALHSDLICNWIECNCHEHHPHARHWLRDHIDVNPDTLIAQGKLEARA